MIPSHVQTNRELGVLHQLFTSATHEASTAMCRWTDGLVTLTVDEVRSVSLQEACPTLDMGDELAHMVVVSLAGERGGEVVLSFDEANGRALAASVLKTVTTSGAEWTELEKSALLETGNILACAYANALTRLIGSEMVPSVPSLVRDYAASVLQQAVLAQAIHNDTVVVCRTIFHREGRELSWRVIFVPTLELQRALEEAVHVR